MQEFFYQNFQWAVLLFNIITSILLTVSICRKKLFLYTYYRCKIDYITAYLSLFSLFLVILCLTIDFIINELIWSSFGVIFILCDLLYVKEKENKSVVIDNFLYKNIIKHKY